MVLVELDEALVVLKLLGLELVVWLSLFELLLELLLEILLEILLELLMNVEELLVVWVDVSLVNVAVRVVLVRQVEA